jgi:hypothetical protein
MGADPIYLVTGAFIKTWKQIIEPMRTQLVKRRFG